MNTVACKGILQHRFHGTYTCAIGLAFADRESASDALRTLGERWMQSKADPRGLVWSGDSAELEAIKERFHTYGLSIEPCGWRHCRDRCASAEIDSLAHSIDVGPNFRLTSIPIVSAEQLTLGGSK